MLRFCSQAVQLFCALSLVLRWSVRAAREATHGLSVLEGGVLRSHAEAQHGRWRQPKEDAGALLERGRALEDRGSLGAHGTHVEGHQVSEVSARWGGQVVYGVLTSNAVRYHEKQVAQLDTWARLPADQGRWFAVGPRAMPSGWLREGVVLRSPCLDDLPHVGCKEATMILEGAARGAAWMVILGEDNYVIPSKVEEFLAAKDPDEPAVYGCVGCGVGSGFCPGCDIFAQNGGLCGGCGYFISRGALQKMATQGAAPLRDYFDSKVGWPGDMVTSCWLRSNQVPFFSIFDRDGVYGWGVQTYDKLASLANNSFMTLHYQTPEMMRWMHARRLNTSSSEWDADVRRHFVNCTRWTCGDPAGASALLEAEASDGDNPPRPQPGQPAGAHALLGAEAREGEDSKHQP